jgi:hypothetical protein
VCSSAGLLVMTTRRRATRVSAVDSADSEIAFAIDVPQDDDRATEERWRKWGLRPWRTQTFKFSTDPELEASCMPP